MREPPRRSFYTSPAASTNTSRAYTSCTLPRRGLRGGDTQTPDGGPSRSWDLNFLAVDVRESLVWIPSQAGQSMSNENSVKCDLFSFQFLPFVALDLHEENFLLADADEIRPASFRDLKPAHFHGGLQVGFVLVNPDSRLTHSPPGTRRRQKRRSADSGQKARVFLFFFAFLSLVLSFFSFLFFFVVHFMSTRCHWTYCPLCNVLSY